MIAPELLSILLCPSCGSALRDQSQFLECTQCKAHYPVEEGVPNLLLEVPKGLKG